MHKPKHIVFHLSIYTTYRSELPEMDSFINKKIDEYIALYFDFLSDYGWTVALTEFIETVDDEQYIAKAKARNLIGFVTFFKNLSTKSQTSQFIIETNHTLEDFLEFCNSIIVSKEGLYQSRNIDYLVEVIKLDDAQALTDIVISDPSMIAKTCPSNSCQDEIGFTPLMKAAKYSQNEATIKALFLHQPTKGEKITHIQVKAAFCQAPVNNYDSMMIAAFWGNPKIFQYLFTIVSSKVKTLDQLKNILECICAGYLPSTNNRNEQVQQQFLNYKKDVLAGLAHALLMKQPDYEKWFGSRIVPAPVKQKLMIFQTILLKMKTVQHLIANAAERISQLEVPVLPERQFNRDSIANVSIFRDANNKRKLSELTQALPANDSSSSPTKHKKRL
jgi:hypothetical protein